ncbi:hypothetical protein 7712_00030 [Pseudomonas phage bmx-p2]|nr:hypothetical protein 7712_00030 [Pseudomonas phage bmx-p2]
MRAAKNKTAAASCAPGFSLGWLSLGSTGTAGALVLQPASPGP